MSKPDGLAPGRGLSLDELIGQIDTRLEALRPLVSRVPAARIRTHCACRRLRERHSRIIENRRITDVHPEADPETCTARRQPRGDPPSRKRTSRDHHQRDRRSDRHRQADHSLNRLRTQEKRSAQGRWRRRQGRRHARPRRILASEQNETVKRHREQESTHESENSRETQSNRPSPSRKKHHRRESGESLASRRQRQRREQRAEN
jgi:hypothetical protein